MGDVQITIQQGGKSIPLQVAAGTQIGGTSVKQGSIVKMTKEEFAAFQKLASLDGVKNNLSAEDLKKFNSYDKAKQTQLINDALKNNKSNYKVGIVTDGIEEGSIHTRSNMAAINMTPDGKKVMEDDSTARFFGVYIQDK